MGAVPDWFVTNLAITLAREQDNITIRDPTETQNVSTYFGERGEWDEGPRADIAFESDSATPQPALGLERRTDPDYADGRATIPFHYRDEYVVDYDAPADDDGLDEPPTAIVAECSIDGDIGLSYNGGDIRAWVDLEVTVGEKQPADE